MKCPQIIIALREVDPDRDFMTPFLLVKEHSICKLLAKPCQGRLPNPALSVSNFFSLPLIGKLLLCIFLILRNSHELSIYKSCN